MAGVLIAERISALAVEGELEGIALEKGIGRKVLALTEDQGAALQ
jgi:hypothetical protein